MPGAAVRSRGTQGRAGGPPAQASQNVLRFTAAAHEHREPITTQVVTPGAQLQSSNPSNIDINAFGFLQSVVLEVSALSGVLGAGVLSADYPFNLFSNVAIQDVNGAYLFGPFDGFAALQAIIYGGYAYRQDPRLASIYVGTINAVFCLRIPSQVLRHNAYGALPNQNAAANYKLSWTVNTSVVMFSTAPTTIPTFTIKAWVETWSQPNATDLLGRPQAQEPPMTGSTQYWTQYTKATNVGNNVIQLPRVGNLIRVIVVIARNTSAGAPRDDTVFPDPFLLQWDARVLTNESQRLRQQLMSESLEAPTARDAGVFAFMFNNIKNGRIGDEDPDLWLHTVQATRLEIDGSAVTAGNLQIMTCDISPVEVDQADRYVMESATGFSPSGVAGATA